MGRDQRSGPPAEADAPAGVSSGRLDARDPFESVFDPGDADRLHVHRREDEIGYVLEGALEARLPDRTLVLEAGGVARLPKGIPHAIRKPLGTPSRYLFLCVPAGLDQWLDALRERGAMARWRAGRGDVLQALA